MGFYSRTVFPRLLDVAMSIDMVTEQRKEVLARATGSVLEIGFGTGLNLLHYPDSVEHLTAIDPNPGANSLAKRRLANTTIPVEQIQLKGESLSMPDSSFDTVVSTWTLCSIADVSQALSEVRRVLKPDGELLFIEHGLSPDSEVEVWQHRLNGVQQVLGDGCNLNRNIAQLIRDAGFNIASLEMFYMSQVPKFIGHSYKGVATPA